MLFFCLGATNFENLDPFFETSLVFGGDFLVLGGVGEVSFYFVGEVNFYEFYSVDLALT